MSTTMARQTRPTATRVRPCERLRVCATLTASAAALATAVMLTSACSATRSLTSASELATTHQDSQSTTVPKESAMPESNSSTPIRIVIGDSVVTGELWDNAPGQALRQRLPLKMTFSDLNAVEKTAHLEPPLPMTGMPAGDDPQPRDIGWYAPTGDVVLYYGDVSYWPGIARIGHITDGIDLIADHDDDFTATIEPAT